MLMFVEAGVVPEAVPYITTLIGIGGTALGGALHRKHRKEIKEIEKRRKSAVAHEMSALVKLDKAEQATADAEKRSNIDKLTGLSNREAFLAAVDRQLQSEQRHPGQAAFIMALDIDNFKDINDSLGHREGNNKIISVSSALTGRLRKGDDMVSRLHGDEFAVLAKNVDPKQAEILANGLIQAVNEISEVKISLGLTQTDPSLSPEDNLERADAALYQAKNAGRNRVVSA
jgi:diguanylate cyclase (GGDEF)-like protein